jgi:glutamate racemase
MSQPQPTQETWAQPDQQQQLEQQYYLAAQASALQQLQWYPQAYHALLMQCESQQKLLQQTLQQNLQEHIWLTSSNQAIAKEIRRLTQEVQNLAQEVSNQRNRDAEDLEMRQNLQRLVNQMPRSIGGQERENSEVPLQNISELLEGLRSQIRGLSSYRSPVSPDN